MRIPRIITSGCLCLFLVPTLARAVDAPHTVIDEAQLFTPQGVERARRLIDQIYQRREFAVVVETLPALPAALLKQLSRAGTTASGRLFKSFALERAQQQKIDGLYILISADPNFRLAQVFTSPESHKSRFSDSYCNKVRLSFVSRHNTTNHDPALMEALDEVDALLASNQHEIGVFWTSVPIFFAMVVGMWLIMLLRRDQSPKRPEVPSLATPETGQANLFGSMVGTPANQWIYDNTLQPPTSGS